MAHQINGLFSSNHQQMRGGHPQHQQQPVWSLQDFPPIGGHAQTGNVLFMPDRQMPTQYQANGFARPQMAVQPQPLLGGPIQHPIPVLPEIKTTIQGIGKLTWLSAKAGLISCDDGNTISFQLKDFCDNQLTDLTSVLRVGFDLKFHAALHETNDYTATTVSPTFGADADLRFAKAVEIDLELASPTPANSKDAYSMVLENKATVALLGAFQRHGTHKIQLSSLHAQMSNYGDDELYRYVGTSSMKRRQFVERRTHLFRLQNDDAIILQFPAVYQGVFLLASFLLRRGGVTSIQSLFDFYMSQDVSQEIRDQNGTSRSDFINILTSHTWVFALFPNRTYVSVRRNLPNYDYVGYVNQYFPELVDAQVARHQMMYAQQGYGMPPQGIQRTMSVPMGGVYQNQNQRGYHPQQQHHHVAHHQMHQQNQMMGGAPINMTQNNVQNSNTQPLSVWGSQSSLDQEVSQVFPAPQSTWSNARVMPNYDSMVNETLFSNSSNINTILASAKNMQSIGVQAETNVVGDSGQCTCQCTCGRGGAAAIGTTRGSSVKDSSGSASPRSIDGNSQSLSPVLNMNGPSFSLNIAPDHQPVGSATVGPNFYDLFGTADFLNGAGMNSLRIN